MNILVMNAGSSSLKCGLYVSGVAKPLWQALVDWTHLAGVAEVKIAALGVVQREALPLDANNLPQARAQIIAHVLRSLWHGDNKVIDGPHAIGRVGHRVVHGGQNYRHPVRITSAVKADIRQLASLAPVHNPANLEGIEIAEQVLGGNIPHLAVFDTAFHSQMPPEAALYALPHDWSARGIRRYGFHGISHQYCAQRVAQVWQRNLADLRLITCHLGNGCSLAAIRDGHSIDTTMGFTPLDGLMMGTRSGSVDPGILIHLLREGHTAEQLDHALNKQSGLLGVSGVASDFRGVLAAMTAGDANAKLAVDMFIHRLNAGIGAMLMSLGGLDALVFTAGIGENSALVRARVCEQMAFLGVKLDAAANQSSPLDADIASPDSTVRVFVIHTQEDWAIAQACDG